MTGQGVQTSANNLGELRREIWFGKKCGVAAVSGYNLGTVAAAVNDPKSGFAPPKLHGQVASGHPFGHDHVRKQQINPTVVLVPNPKRFDSRSGFDDIVVILG